MFKCSKPPETFLVALQNRQKKSIYITEFKYIVEISVNLNKNLCINKLRNLMYLYLIVLYNLHIENEETNCNINIRINENLY